MKRINKANVELNDVKHQVNHLETSKNYDKSFQGIHQQIKILSTDLQERINRKYDIVDMIEEKKRVNDKISILHQNIIDKAEKSEVKKALVFIENKIKEIITLIACSQNE